MSKPRLGRAERALVKAWHEKRIAHNKAIVAANMTVPLPSRSIAPRSLGFKSLDLKAKMTHGLYRGLYDPMFSTERDTGRGRTIRGLKTKGAKLKA